MTTDLQSAIRLLMSLQRRIDTGLEVYNDNLTLAAGI